MFSAVAGGDGVNLEELARAYRERYPPDPAELARLRVFKRAVANVPLGELVAADQDEVNRIGNVYSTKVRIGPITNQFSSNRCWIFAGLSMLRESAYLKIGKRTFQFSQGHIFFYDQLEKANLFLSKIVDANVRATITGERSSRESDRLEDLLRNPVCELEHAGEHYPKVRSHAPGQVPRHS
jgi:aminopeptidase C